MLDAEQVAVLERWRAAFSPALNATATGLRSAHALEPVDARIEVSGRSKKRPAITAKLVAKPRMRLSQMEDVAGCRVVLPSLDDVYRLRDHVQRTSRRMSFDRTDDYVESPRDGGYRAVHLHARRTVTRAGRDVGARRVEIQLRTRRQHGWADEVESFDELAGTDVKHEEADADILRYWADRAALLAAWDAGRDDADERARWTRSVARLRELLEEGLSDGNGA